MKTWQRVFLVLVALATASGGYLFTSRRLASGQEALPASTQLVEVRRGNLTVGVTSVGNIVLPQQANLSFGVVGTIAEILVKEGDTVKTGQPLARLEDTSSFQLAVAQAQADLKQSQKNLDDAKKQSPTVVPQAEQAVSNARVALQTAQDALAEAQAIDPVALTQKEQAVANARVVLESAQQALADAQKPFSDQDLADAKAAVVSAQRSWELAKQDIPLTRQTWDVKVKQAEDNLAATLEAYQNKVRLYYGVELTEEQAYQDPSTIVPNPDAIFAWQNLMPPSQRPLDQSTIETTIRTAWQALLTARDNRESQQIQRDKAIMAAEQAERQAGANLRKAQETLDNMVVDPLQVALRKTQVATAQANLQKAIDDLAEFNKGPDPLNVALKKAQVATAQANLQKALEDLETAKAGPDPILVELRQAQLSSVQESLTTAQKNLASTTLTAPFAGVINSISLKVGERIGTNTVMMQIVDHSQAEVRATLDEIDLSRVKSGQRVTITLEALPGTRINGQVAFVALVGTRTSGVVTYPLKITMTLPSGVVLRDGVTAILNVVVEEKRGVLLVPTRALKRQGRDWIAQVLVDGKPQDRLVTVGTSSDQQTEIVSGLEEGDQVVITTTAATRTATTPGAAGGAFGGGFIPGVGGVPPGGRFR